MRKASAGGLRPFFDSGSIVAGWVKLNRQVWKQNILFGMCWLWGYPQIGGLDSFGKGLTAGEWSGFIRDCYMTNRPELSV